MERIEELEIKIEKAKRKIKELNRKNEWIEKIIGKSKKIKLEKIKSRLDRKFIILNKSIEEMEKEIIKVKIEYEFIFFCKKYNII